MRSDLQHLVNLGGAQLRPEHADTLLRHLDPTERVTALHALPLRTPTCVCVTTARLLVVDGRRGDQVRELARDPGTTLAALRRLTGRTIRFATGAEVLELRGVARQHVRALERSSAARDASCPTPTSADAPPDARPLVQLALAYVDVLVDVTVRDGSVAAFLDAACGGLPLVDDHAYRFFVACEALHALCPADQGASDLARQLYDVLVEWFLGPTGAPAVMPQLAAALRPGDPALLAARQQHLDVLRELCDGLPAEDGAAVRRHRAAFLAQLHHRHGLEAPVEELSPPRSRAEGGAVAEQLEELRGLLEEGLLSDEEFAAAKQRLLAA